LASCNKSLPEATPIVTPAPSGQSLATIINTDPNFSTLKAAVTRAGSNLSFNPADSTAVYTMFAPDNDAFTASGISVGMINAMPAAQVASILNYHVIPGLKVASGTISTKFPNDYMQSTLLIAPISASLPTGLRMSLFPCRRTDGAWVNQIPIKAVDKAASNGVMHTVAGVLVPPTSTLKGTMMADSANYSLFLAAIARADSGIARANQFDSLLNFAIANFTVFAPTNNAFRALFPPGTPDNVIIAILNNPAVFTATQVRGIVAYHLLGSRAFSVNMATTPTPVNTLLALPQVPTGVPVVITRTGNAVTVKGLANASAANVTSANIHSINGVIHRIDQVLLPQ
jgi:uncharacterized surface protein with fasciclin (FAS1) repeats